VRINLPNWYFSSEYWCLSSVAFQQTNSKTRGPLAMPVWGMEKIGYHILVISGRGDSSRMRLTLDE
jgi:hypothetical protein